MGKKENDETFESFVALLLLAFILGAIVSTLSPFLTVMIVFLITLLLIRRIDKKRE